MNGKKIPWSNIVREDFHVIVYEDVDGLIFMPKYNTDYVLRDAMSDAVIYGNKLVADNSIISYTTDIIYIDEYPHVRFISQNN